MTWLYICVVAFMVGTHRGVGALAWRLHRRQRSQQAASEPFRATPRVGGLAVLAGTLAGLLVLGPSNMTLTWLWPALFVAALPVFVAGLLEDITRTSAPASACWRRSVPPPSPGGCWAA